MSIHTYQPQNIKVIFIMDGITEKVQQFFKYICIRIHIYVEMIEIKLISTGYNQSWA